MNFARRLGVDWEAKLQTPRSVAVLSMARRMSMEIHRSNARSILHRLVVIALKLDLDDIPSLDPTRDYDDEYEPWINTLTTSLRRTHGLYGHGCTAFNVFWVQAV